MGYVKFMFSNKATQIDEIFTIDLTLCSKCQIDGIDVGTYPPGMPPPATPPPATPPPATPPGMPPPAMPPGMPRPATPPPATTPGMPPPATPPGPTSKGMLQEAAKQQQLLMYVILKPVIVGIHLHQF